MAHCPNFLANGNILPSRFVVADTTGDFLVVQATDATHGILGVSQDGTDQPPGVTGSGSNAAQTGESLQVFCDGDEALITAGGTITEGDYLVSDTSGRAVTATLTSTGIQYIGGRALQAATGAGQLIRMFVHPQAYFHS
jgi:hypothetical protein